MPIVSGLHKTYRRLRVTKVQLAQVYYIIDGRNAWHQTWVERYRPDCMQANLQDAKNVCENKRVQGTVFRITQLPAISFSTLWGVSLLFTQINTSSPLQELRQHRLEGALKMVRRDEELRILNEKSQRVNSERPMGLFFQGIWNILHCGSEVYLPSMPKENSVMTFCSSSLTKLDEIDPSNRFKGWQSEAIGSACSLNWTQFDRVYDLSTLIKIYIAFQSELKQYKTNVK